MLYEVITELEAGTLHSTTYQDTGKKVTAPGRREARISRDNPVPKPPFLGTRHVTDIPTDLLFPYVNEQALFRGRRITSYNVCYTKLLRYATIGCERLSSTHRCFSFSYIGFTVSSTSRRYSSASIFPRRYPQRPRNSACSLT